MNKEELIQKLSIATGINAFTKEPVYDKLKLEAITVIEELSEEVDYIALRNAELMAKVAELEATLNLVQSEKLAASQGPKGHGYAYWKKQAKTANDAMSNLVEQLHKLDSLLFWNKLAKAKVRKMLEDLERRK